MIPKLLRFDIDHNKLYRLYGWLAVPNVLIITNTLELDIGDD